MRAVVTEGTARRAQFGEFEIAGKTGTSNDYRDSWFAGFSGSHLAVVWMGHDAFPIPGNTSILDFHGRPKPAALAIRDILLADKSPL